jgi:hypothetical protein
MMIKKFIHKLKQLVGLGDAVEQIAAAQAASAELAAKQIAALSTRVVTLNGTVLDRGDFFRQSANVLKVVHHEISTVRLEAVFKRPIFSTSIAALPPPLEMHQRTLSLI